MNLSNRVGRFRFDDPTDFTSNYRRKLARDAYVVRHRDLALGA
jgi:hypothetical protein